MIHNESGHRDIHSTVSSTQLHGHTHFAMCNRVHTLEWASTVGRVHVLEWASTVGRVHVLEWAYGLSRVHALEWASTLLKSGHPCFGVSIDTRT